MKTITYSLLASLLILAAGCSKEALNPEKVDYFIFGHFYGECVGEGCVEMFRVKDGILYEDTNDNYPSSSLNSYNGDWVELSSDKYELVKDLIEEVPQDIYEEDDVIGQPDAGDWGGFYLEIKQDGQKENWLIDTMKDNIPEFLHDLNDAIEQAISDAQG